MSLLAPRILNGLLSRTIGAGAGGVTYLIEENFEATGYDLSWTESSGTPNEDYATSPAPLQGTQSLYMNGTAASQEVRSPVLTDASALYGYFLFHPLTLPGGTRDIIRFRLNGSQAGSSRIGLTSTGQLLLTNGTTSTTATVATMSVGTTYHVHYGLTTGGGADGEGWVAFTTDGTVGTGNNLSTRINHNGTSQFDQIALFAQFSTTGPEYIMDRVLVNSTAIGANP